VIAALQLFAIVVVAAVLTVVAIATAAANKPHREFLP
jgi:hypothetical protein